MTTTTKILTLVDKQTKTKLEDLIRKFRKCYL